MDCNYICQKVHQAIIKYQKENPDPTDAIVVIDIKQPIDDSSYILRLEHNSNPT
jgi:hypothetical protein